MTQKLTQISYTDKTGKIVSRDFDHTTYKEAADKRMTLPVLLNLKYQDADFTKGTVFEQAVANSGMLLSGRRIEGVSAPSMQEILNSGINMGAILAPDGNNNNVSARILFPQVILETMRSYIGSDYSDFVAKYKQLVGLDESVASSKVEQPTIDERANESVESGQIAQLSEPPSLVTITTGDTTHRIPTDSIGLLISDEALGATSLDLVNLAMSAHARGKRIRMVENDIRAMVHGDKDRGMNALPVMGVTSLDPAASGKFTRKAWINFLYQAYKKRSINAVMMSLSTAMDLDEELVAKNHSTDTRQTSVGFGISNLDIPAPKILLVGDDVLSAGLVAGLDTRYAIRRLTNVSASYEAIEDFALRRAKGFRVDHGETSKRLYDEAWQVVDLSA